MNNDAIQPVDEIQPADKISTSEEHLDEWVLEMEGRLISHATRPSKQFEKRPSIFGNWQCWNDFGASFIPETQKWHFVACMAHWFGLNLRSYLEYMQEKEDLAWSYYRGVNEKFCAENTKRFIEHLLVHSCFLIFAMVFLSGKDYKEVIVDKMNDQNNFPKGLTAKEIQNIVDFLLVDPIQTKGYMLTMNYQIPWFVVEAVYTELSNLSQIFHTPIHQIALSCFDKLCPREHPSRKDGGIVLEGVFKHLLHIFHWSRTPDGKYLQLFPAKPISRFHIPSATELHLSQIVFVKDEGGSIDLSYSDNMRLSGQMQLTPWHLYQYSPKLFESLLRFERDYVGLGKPFTAYVACMSCLLKTEGDVRILRENCVIPPTTPFDDKDVLRCVQELKTFIPDDLRMPDELILLEEKAMAHYQRSAYRLYGEFKRRYCSSPWISISVIAGICLFVLTLMQTVLSFIQTKNSVPNNNTPPQQKRYMR